jgi:hypothetical protein
MRSLSILFAGLLPGVLFAQVTANTGARVRVDANGKGIVTGQFLTSLRDSILILRCPACQPDAIARSDIHGIVVSQRPEFSLLRTTTFGLLGAGAGVLLGVKVTANSGCHEGPCGVIIVPLGVVGATVGNIIGSRERRERWIPARLP